MTAQQLKIITYKHNHHSTFRFYGKYIRYFIQWNHGFPGGSDGKESAHNTGDLGSIAGLMYPLEKGRFPGEGNGYPLQYSCLENSMDRGSWWATVHGVAKSQTLLYNVVFVSAVQQSELVTYLF